MLPRGTSPSVASLCALLPQGLGRRLRMSLGFLYGWMGLPLPRRHPLYMVTGKPIAVHKVNRRSSCLHCTALHCARCCHVPCCCHLQAG